MLIGDSISFAIESEITKAYVNPGLRALGLFVVHIDRRRFGVHSPEASLLANSFDAVSERIRCRGTHTAPFSDEPSGHELADAVVRALYCETERGRKFFDLEEREFVDLIHSRHLLWVPDGDQAFDDGSHILQFDLDDRVRLVAFKREEAELYEPQTLVDAWLPSETFYGALISWSSAFELEWRRSARVSG